MNVVFNGLLWEITYTEPTTNSDSSPLNDLKETQVFHDDGLGGPFQARNPSPATSPQGGGIITSGGSMASFMGPNESRTFRFYTLAIDNDLNISLPSPVVTGVCETLAPAPPS